MEEISDQYPLPTEHADTFSKNTHHMRVKCDRYTASRSNLRGTAAPTRKDPAMELLRTHEPLEAFVFDMDGTLLDSLPDLVDVTNETLTHFGYPTHTTEEI